MTATGNIYCLDTSALLLLADAYTEDDFPEVWELLSEEAASGAVMAPREVRRELEKKEDNGALSWVRRNASILRPLDARQATIVRQIVNSSRFPRLIDPDSESPDADPFVIALAATRPPGLAATAPIAPAVVGAKAPSVRTCLSEVCEEPGYRIRFLSPHEMLFELGLDVPDPHLGGLSGLYGIWSEAQFTEDEIAASRLRVGSADA